MKLSMTTLSVLALGLVLFPGCAEQKPVLKAQAPGEAQEETYLHTDDPVSEPEDPTGQETAEEEFQEAAEKTPEASGDDPDDKDYYDEEQSSDSIDP